MRYAALSDVGRVRENNEDAFHADGRLFIVADGMGGHRAGEVASSVAVEEFLSYERENRRVEPLQRLKKGIQAANRAVLSMASEDRSLKGMGTTFTVLLLEKGAYLGHVGDSRAYLLREGKINLLTRDHSLVEKMVREGYLSPREAREHPKRNIILRALGMSGEPSADLVRVEVQEGDRIILCTDGLTSHIEDLELAAMLTEERDPETCARRLIQEANARGGEDNVTVVIVDLEEGDEAVIATLGKGGTGEGAGAGSPWWRRLKKR